MDDYPLVVVPQREYLLLHLAQLRDNPILFQNMDVPNGIGINDHTLSPRTPLREPPNIEEDDTNHSLEVAAVERIWSNWAERYAGAVESVHENTDSEMELLPALGGCEGDESESRNNEGDE